MDVRIGGGLEGFLKLIGAGLIWTVMCEFEGLAPGVFELEYCGERQDPSDNPGLSALDVKSSSLEGR